jgi:hypothetical protein
MIWQRDLPINSHMAGIKPAADKSRIYNYGHLTAIARQRKNETPERKAEPGEEREVATAVLTKKIKERALSRDKAPTLSYRCVIELLSSG